MGVLIDRRAAGKYGDGFLIHRLKGFYVFTEGIEELEHAIIPLFTIS
jgi:hypothetical protein